MVYANYTRQKTCFKKSMDDDELLTYLTKVGIKKTCMSTRS
jgi:hypothetical protein